MTGPTGPGLTSDVDGPIATITLDRPEKLNALTPEMLEGLEATLGAIEADESIRVVIITGSGDRAFCAGADVLAWSALSPIDMWRQFSRWWKGEEPPNGWAGAKLVSHQAIGGFLVDDSHAARAITIVIEAVA